MEVLRRRHTEGVVLAANGLRIAAKEVSYDRLYTDARSYQALPEPTPTTLMGEQVRPTSTLTSWRTTPMDLRIGATVVLLAGSTDLQHWIGPVAQLAPKAGVAAARMGREATAKAKARENIMLLEAGCW